MAIDAGMQVGQRYSLGLWAKGTSNSGRVLSLYANGDPVIISTPDQLTEDWSYYEISFTASFAQINLLASDWGNTDIYIDNITLKNADGVDLLSGRGDFWYLGGADSHNYVSASCTEPEICFACGKIGEDALGHSYGNWDVIQAATLQNAGSRQRKCLTCGETETEEIPCLAGAVEGWSLTLGADLTVNFIMRIHPDIQSTAQVVLTVAEESTCYTVSEHTPGDSGAYRFSVPVAAAQMADDITVQIINGQDASTPQTYRVVDYARYILANESMSSYHRLVKEMLSYGAAAQVYFGYNTSDLVDTDITGAAMAEIPADAAAKQKIEDYDANINFYGASLVFRDKIGIRYYFTVFGNADDLTFTVNGEVCKAAQKGELYYVEITDINPQDLDDTLWASAGNVTVSYCPMNYLLRMSQKGSENLKALMKALYNYHLAAESFLES